MQSHEARVSLAEEEEAGAEERREDDDGEEEEEDDDEEKDDEEDESDEDEEEEEEDEKESLVARKPPPTWVGANDSTGPLSSVSSVSKGPPHICMGAAGALPTAIWEFEKYDGCWMSFSFDDAATVEHAYPRMLEAAYSR